MCLVGQVHLYTFYRWPSIMGRKWINVLHTFFPTMVVSPPPSLHWKYHGPTFYLTKNHCQNTTIKLPIIWRYYNYCERPSLLRHILKISHQHPHQVDDRDIWRYFNYSELHILSSFAVIQVWGFLNLPTFGSVPPHLITPPWKITFPPRRYTNYMKMLIIESEPQE